MLGWHEEKTYYMRISAATGLLIHGGHLAVSHDCARLGQAGCIVRISQSDRGYWSGCLWTVARKDIFCSPHVRLLLNHLNHANEYVKDICLSANVLQCMGEFMHVVVALDVDQVSVPPSTCRRTRYKLNPCWESFGFHVPPGFHDHLA